MPHLGHFESLESSFDSDDDSMETGSTYEKIRMSPTDLKYDKNLLFPK